MLRFRPAFRCVCSTRARKDGGFALRVVFASDIAVVAVAIIFPNNGFPVGALHLFSPLRYTIKALVIKLECFVNVAPHFIDRAHLAKRDALRQEIAVAVLLLCLCSFRHGSTSIIQRHWIIFQRKFVDLHGLLEFSSLDLDAPQHVQKDDETRMVSA